jgi:integrase
MADRRAGKLNPLKVASTSAPGMHHDGGGLYLRVDPRSGTKSWAFRFQLHGKRREMGLGAVDAVTLAEARRKAEDCRRQLEQNVDPIVASRTAAAAARGVPTFREAAARFLDSHRDGWRNPKHRAQWESTLATYAFPKIGDLSVADLVVGDVLAVLEPIWKTKAETASRLRGRIEAIIDWAIARNYRGAENPARWRGLLQNLLPNRAKIARVEHHPALPWRDLPTFMHALQTQSGTAARALEFAILTAARSGEVRGATWGEIDLKRALWTVPGARMKAGRDHRVPLSEPALAVLAKMRTAYRFEHDADPPADAFVFPGGRSGKPLSENAMLKLLARMKRADITGHGFRSTFRDWAAEATTYPREIAEAALAHVNKDRVEAAYLRGDHLEKRAALMRDWAAFTMQESAPPTAFGGGRR